MRSIMKDTLLFSQTLAFGPAGDSVVNEYVKSVDTYSPIAL